MKSGSVLTIGKIDPNIDVYLKDMLIRNGIGTLDSYSVLGGGILNKGTLTVDHCTIQNNGYYTSPWDSTPGTYGGGIYSSGDLTVTDSTISNNLANGGSGIYLDNSGKSPLELKAVITDSAISSNRATNGGGGIFNSGGDLTLKGNTISENWGGYWDGGGIVNTGGILEMVSGTISGNGASGNGGGVMNYGTFTMKGGSISDNTAYNGPAGTWYNGQGGGIYNNVGTLNLEGGSLSNNHAYDGAGIYNYYGTLNLIGGSISGNIARINGGGIYNFDYSGTGSKLFIGGTTQIINNEATSGYGGGIYSSNPLVTFDGPGVAVKSNKAKLPSPSELSWYQGWGVYMSSDISPTKFNGFDPSTQVTDNTRIPEWTVNPGELIQSYIDKAISGDTIEISPGIFNENLVIDKSLTLKGAGSTESGTVVKGLGTDNGDNYYDGLGDGSVFNIGPYAVVDLSRNDYHRGRRNT